MGPTYTTTVDLSTSNGSITVANVSGASSQLTAVSFLSGPKGDTGATGATGPAGTTDYNALTNKPIIPTDNAQLTNGASYATTTAVAAKQATLVSGTNIKTVNGTSLLGSGNLAINAAVWGNITGDYNNQADLIAALAGKADSSDLLTYAPKNSPALTGTPTTPTPVNTDNSTKIANTEFVATAVANLINSAPTTLDTLNELATALGNDPNFATTVTTSLAAKASTSYVDTQNALKVSKDSLMFNVKDHGAVGNGSTDDTSAIQSTIAAAVSHGGGIVFIPAGTYLTSSALTISTGITIRGESKKTTIIKNTSSTVFSFASTCFWWEVDHLSVQATGGHIFAASNNLSAFHIHHVSFQQNANGFSIWNQSTGTFVEAYFDHCDFILGGSAPTVPAFSLIDTTGSFNANIWENCVATTTNASSAYFFSLVAQGSGNNSYGNTFRNIVFEQCIGGAIFAQSQFGLLLDNVAIWDGNIIGVSTADYIHIGKYSTGLSSRDITIRNYNRQSSTLGSGLYDISFDGNSQQFVLESIRSAPDNLNINLNNSTLGQVINQSPGTIITNGTGTVSQFGSTGDPNTVAVWNARVGDIYYDQAATGGAAIWRCSVAGSPGTWVAAVTSGSTSDATTSTKGIVQLAGDLAGTAAAPTVPGLAAKASLTGTETLTNKTLTSPVISTISNTGTITLPTTSGTLIQRSDSVTIQNKTLDNTNILTPKAGSFTLQDSTDTTRQAKFSVANVPTATSATFALPAANDTLVGRVSTDTLTNKIISGSSNTLSNIPESAVTNLTTDLASKITVGAWTTWTPTFTGFSPDPVGIHQYRMLGSEVEIIIRQYTAGTSNAATFTISLPIPAATVPNMVWEGFGRVMNNSTFVAAPGYASVASGSSTLNVFINTGTTAWGTINGKAVDYLRMIYQA